MMNERPFFSIVIPVYNSEKFLNDCIESVFSQSCKDYELILVDDESSDNSPAICDCWAEKHPSVVHVVHQKNEGVYIAKRNGISHSKGSYVFVMDNDDLLVSTNTLEEIKEMIKQNNADLVIFNATDNLDTGHLVSNPPFYDGQIFENDDLVKIYDCFLSTKDLHHIWMMVFKRNLFDWDYNYCESFRMMRDGPFLVLPIISQARKILYLDRTYYYWRIQNTASASKHYDVVDFFYSVRLLHERIIEYYEKWEYKTKRTCELIKSNYVTDICIAAIKARSLSDGAGISRTDYLKLLSQDDYFRSCYSLKYLELFRKAIAFALYHKFFIVVNGMSSVVGLIKRR